MWLLCNLLPRRGASSAEEGEHRAATVVPVVRAISVNAPHACSILCDLLPCRPAIALLAKEVGEE
jgi:hypothetical protein